MAELKKAFNVDVPTYGPPDQLIWDIFFSQLVTMSIHPGNKHELNLIILGLLADDMMIERNKRCPQ